MIKSFPLLFVALHQLYAEQQRKTKLWQHVADQQCLHSVTTEASAGAMQYKINYQSITGDNKYVWIAKVSGN